MILKQVVLFELHPIKKSVREEAASYWFQYEFQIPDPFSWRRGYWRFTFLVVNEVSLYSCSVLGSSAKAVSKIGIRGI